MKHNDEKQAYNQFACWFKRSQRAVLAERLFTFLFVLSCSYAASEALDMALNRNISGLLRTGTALAVLLAVGLPVVWLLSKWTGREQIWDRQRFREEMYGRILTNRLEAASMGEQEQLLGNISDQVAEQYQTRIPGILEELCIILVATALMCLERPSIGLLFSAMSLIQIIPVFTYEKWTKKIYEESWDSDEAETDWIAQGVDGIRTLKAYGAESWFIQRYRTINRRGIAVGNKAITAGGLENILYTSMNAALRYGSYLILGLYVLYRDLPVSSLPILVMLSGYIFSSMDQMFTFFRYRSTYRMAIQRLEEALRQAPAEGDPGVLRAEGIEKSFADKRVLTGVDLLVAPCQRVLLKGANGAGKSTLLRILTGELTPDAGTVHSGMRTAVALQEDPDLPEAADSFLNVLEGQADWDVDRFRTHLRAFQFPEELLARPIQELSGGERKKLFLAVALAREADLLILDEPTNHLDGESRAYLKDVLHRCECAMLICTHDPEFCLPWDKTIVLEGGMDNG